MSVCELSGGLWSPKPTIIFITNGPLQVRPTLFAIGLTRLLMAFNLVQNKVSLESGLDLYYSNV